MICWRRVFLKGFLKWNCRIARYFLEVFLNLVLKADLLCHVLIVIHQGASVQKSEIICFRHELATLRQAGYNLVNNAFICLLKL